MVVSISTRRNPATDLGFLLRKHPDRTGAFRQTFGMAHVVFPEASPECCTCALIVEVDPVGLIRRRRGPSGEGGALDQYVNDRPYAASSFLAVALGDVFRSAMTGRCAERPELATEAWPFTVEIPCVPCRGGEALLRGLFEPLGYTLEAIALPLDDQFPEWGDSAMFSVRLTATLPLHRLLSHLYVLLPVLDNDKHYWVGDDEVEKLLRHGADWLASHPSCDLITRRYLKHRRHLIDDALDQLESSDPDDPSQPDPAVLESQLESVISPSNGAATSSLPFLASSQGDEDIAAPNPCPPGAVSRSAPEEGQPASLHELRLETVVEELLRARATSVLDLGCGEGRLLRCLLAEPAFQRITGMDVSHVALERAAERLNLDRLPPARRDRIQLLHGSLLYRDQRLAGHDAAALVEVIEHLDPPRLAACERVVFEFIRPTTVVITTPNSEYNVRWPTLPAGQFRHRDHRFEWTRAEFGKWATRVATAHGYRFEISPLGPVDPEVGAPSQMAVFTR
jgi:SAM-dependent methyltransferase